MAIKLLLYGLFEISFIPMDSLHLRCAMLLMGLHHKDIVDVLSPIIPLACSGPYQATVAWLIVEARTWRSTNQGVGQPLFDMWAHPLRWGGS